MELTQSLRKLAVWNVTERKRGQINYSTEVTDRFPGSQDQAVVRLKVILGGVDSGLFAEPAPPGSEGTMEGGPVLLIEVRVVDTRPLGAPMEEDVLRRQRP